MRNKAIILLVIITFLGLNIIAQTTTKWRGPNGNGVYEELGLLKEWPASGPEIIWYFEGAGEGHSSAAVANGMIYLAGMTDGDGYIFALSTDGKLSWKASYGKEYTESYPGSRSTPVIVDDLLYIYSGYGVLTCMDAKNGEIKWQKNGFSEFGGKNTVWGVAETVVVDGDKVYVTPGGEENSVVALNRITGELVWSSPGMGEISAYCTPLLIDLPERKLLVTMTTDHIIGIDTDSGELLWSHPQTNRYKVHANTPIFYNGYIFCFSGYGQGGVMLDLSDDGSSVEKVWFNENLDSRMGGMVVVDGYLYGSGDNHREWRCVDWKTGKDIWVENVLETKTEERNGETVEVEVKLSNGVIIYADGMLYCYGNKGDLALVEATPEAFKPVIYTKVELGTAQHWAHPVIDNGRLYLRHGNVLIAYKIK